MVALLTAPKHPFSARCEISDIAKLPHAQGSAAGLAVYEPSTRFFFNRLHEGRGQNSGKESLHKAHEQFSGVNAHIIPAHQIEPPRQQGDGVRGDYLLVESPDLKFASHIR